MFPQSDTSTIEYIFYTWNYVITTISSFDYMIFFRYVYTETVQFMSKNKLELFYTFLFLDLTYRLFSLRRNKLYQNSLLQDIKNNYYEKIALENEIVDLENEIVDLKEKIDEIKEEIDYESMSSENGLLDRLQFESEKTKYSVFI